MKKLPVGIQNITEILSEDYVYIDKTDFALDLITGGKHYFLSRPRRFGKSLLLSTLSEILQGNKKLFRDCKIYRTDYDWQKYPVLTFDFSHISCGSPEEFDAGLKRYIEGLGVKHSLSIQALTIEEGLVALITGLSIQNKVAVLVDEYDKPLINNLHNIDVAEKNRDILKRFYTTLKSLDQYTKITLATGVSKFSQVSLFSGPNNLEDISLDTKFAHVLGYTKEDLKHYFADHIDSLCKKRSCSHDVLIDEITEWYNGYCFSEDCKLVYNPFSTLLFFKKEKALGYWFASGTPSFLIDEIKKRPQAVVPLSGATALRASLSDISRLDQIDLASLMFQTGYLTITGYEDEEDAFHLDFPNREVRQAFYSSLLKEFAQLDSLQISRSAKHLRSKLDEYHINAFVQQINLHFAKIPYQLFTDHEGFYHAIFLTLLEKSGMKTHAEIPTNVGRIDLVAHLQKSICIFELKLDKSATIAFDQAESKFYRERYSCEYKELLVIGLNFCSKSRNISDWKAQLFSPDGQLLKKLK